MFEVIKSIIDHVSDGTLTTEEDLILTICAICIPICIILAWDGICSLFRSFTRFK